MRADRLLSLLMLLQARGRMTARALATELEVSERTIYRDIDALSLSGVPIYGDRGPEGGYALLESYRISLPGLKEDEVRALYMLSIPAPLAQLGVGQELKAALRKLVAALPAAYRADAARVRQRLHLDATRTPGTGQLHLRCLRQRWQPVGLRNHRRRSQRGQRAPAAGGYRQQERPRRQPAELHRRCHGR